MRPPPSSGSSRLRAHRLDRVERVLVGEPLEDVLLRHLLVQRHAVVALGVERLQPVQVVGDRRPAVVARGGSSRRREPRGARGRKRRVGVQDRLVRRVGEARRARAARRRSGPRAARAPGRRASRARRGRSARLAVADPQLDAVRRAADRADAAAEPQPVAEPRRDRIDVRAAAAGHRAPAEAAEAEHAVIVEEADRVRRRELERAPRRRRPERRGERHEEVAAEAAASSRARRGSRPSDCAVVAREARAVRSQRPISHSSAGKPGSRRSRAARTAAGPSTRARSRRS